MKCFKARPSKICKHTRAPRLYTESCHDHVDRQPLRRRNRTSGHHRKRAASDRVLPGLRGCPSETSGSNRAAASWTQSGLRCSLQALAPTRFADTASVTAMRLTVVRIQTERKPQDGSVRRAKKWRRRARMTRVRGPIRPVPGVCAAADAARGEKRLSSGQNHTIFTPADTPLGECRLRSPGTPLWEYRVKVECKSQKPHGDNR